MHKQSLTNPETKVMCLIYGLNTYRHTVEQVATELSISAKKVTIIKNSALAKLLLRNELATGEKPA